MNKRQLSARATRRKLITAGLELIKEKGFDAINVEDITRKAGVAKGSFYTYFKRKEDIVLDISRAPFGEIAEELQNMKKNGVDRKINPLFSQVYGVRGILRDKCLPSVDKRCAGSE